MRMPKTITALLGEIKKGNKQAENQLLLLVYSELHRLARHYMRREWLGLHTLQPSALVNECYLKMDGMMKDSGLVWEDRAHFFVMAARIMRHILVDHARDRNAKKRIPMKETISLENVFAYTDDESWQVVAVHDALEKLKKLDERQCKIVELRVFAGFDVEEVAKTLGISESTVKREFRLAKAWLYGELRNNKKKDGP